MSVSRPEKLSHSHTILYEIDMLRHAAQRLADKWKDEKDEWVYLEAFLVHFRNLIEFLGKENPRADDLSIRKPESFWHKSQQPPDAQLKKLYRPELWAKYEAHAPDRISKYLQHCTEQRIEAKRWEVAEMYNELRETLERFEDLLPSKARAWGVPSLGVGQPLDPFSASTASITS